VYEPRLALCVTAKGFDDPAWSGSNTGSEFISTVSRALYDAWGA
jgi:hypothetical protein